MNANKWKNYFIRGQWRIGFREISGLGVDNAENAEAQRAQRKTKSFFAFSASLRPLRLHREA